MGAAYQIGDIVVAEIDGHSRLKRLAPDERADYFPKDENVLRPDLHPRDSLRIHGALVGLARRY